MNTNFSVSTALAAEIAGIGYEGFRSWLKRGLLKATGILPSFSAPNASAEIADSKRWQWAAFGYAELCSFRLAKNLLDAGLPWEAVNPVVSDHALWQNHRAEETGQYLVMHPGATEWAIYTSEDLVAELNSETRARNLAVLIDLKKLRQDVIRRSRAATLRAVAGDIKRTSKIFATTGNNRLTPDEELARRTTIENLAGEIDQLANEAEQGAGSGQKFTVILRQLHRHGKFPDGPAVSAIAAAFALRHDQ